MEYKIITGKPEEVEKQLNDLTAAGWTVDHVSSASAGGGMFLMFGIQAFVTIILRRDRNSI